MKILITGANGFIGSYLAEYYINAGHEVDATTRDSLNPLDCWAVKSYFDKNSVDIVVHTAVTGGSRTRPDTIDDFHNNITMFNNLSRHRHRYGAMINFGSGAEFCRTSDINMALEEQVFDNYPIDYYGLSKNLITRKIMYMQDNIYNFRLFGCFGPKENKRRLLRASYDKIISGKAPVVHEDKHMDYFYIGDIPEVVNALLRDSTKFPKDINLCYGDKYKLSEIINIFLSLTSYEKRINILNNKGLSYTGNFDKLAKLDLKLKGLSKGMSECLLAWE